MDLIEVYFRFKNINIFVCCMILDCVEFSGMFGYNVLCFILFLVR